MNEWIYILGKFWEAYLYHSIWWNEQFPTCAQNGEEEVSESFIPASTDWSRPCRLQGWTFAVSWDLPVQPSQDSIFFVLLSVGLLRCYLRAKIGLQYFYYWKLCMLWKEDNFFFCSTGWICILAVGKKPTSLCEKIVNLSWVFLRRNEHRAPWSLKLFLQSQF